MQLQQKSPKNNYFCRETCKETETFAFKTEPVPVTRRPGGAGGRYVEKLLINMGIFRRLFTGEHRSFFIFAAVVTGVALLILTFGPGNNIIHWIGAKFEIHSQEKQIEQYTREIEEMDRRIKMLSSDRDTLEKFARENFHFAEPGDDVYIAD